MAWGSIQIAIGLVFLVSGLSFQRGWFAIVSLIWIASGVMSLSKASAREGKKQDEGEKTAKSRETVTMAFERFDTKSHLEAVDGLFSRAVPSLPVVTTEDIRRICGQYLKYDLENGRRHVAGSADHLRPIVVRNLERVSSQLSAGQRIIGFQVFVQSELQFAMLNIFVGDAQGTPGYAFGARFWRTTDQVFVLGWEGFQLSF